MNALAISWPLASGDCCSFFLKAFSIFSVDCFKAALSLPYFAALPSSAFSFSPFGD
jgi:hypothetical protein